MIAGKVIGITWRYGEHQSVIRLLLENRREEGDRGQQVVFVCPVFQTSSGIFIANINIGDKVWTQGGRAMWSANRVDVQANDVLLQQVYGWEGKAIV